MSLILVDGAALYYRAHYAFANRPLTAPSGETTSIAFGFFNSILGLIQSRSPSHLAVVFDRPGKVFRHDLYPAYKANRKPMPDELREQLPRLQELLAAWGVAVLEQDNYEADDLMATLARSSAGVIDTVWHYTGDKDFMQLLDARTGMLKPGRRGTELTEYTLADVRADFGLEPEELVDVFALSGDASDNIPGAPGLGPKTALKLIHAAGSLDALLEDPAAAGATKRQQEILREHREQVLLSRRLFTIDREVPLTVDWELLRTRLPDGPEVRAQLAELGLRQVLGVIDRLVAARDSAADVPSTAATAVDPWDLAARGYRILSDDKSLRDYIDAIPEYASVSVDTETDSLRPDRARLVGVSLAVPGLPAAYVPVRWRVGRDQGTLFPAASEQDRLDPVRRLLAPLLADPAHEKVGQYLKYDEWILARHGMPLAGPRFDTMLASYVLDPGRQRHGLDDLAADHLGHVMLPYDSLFAAGDRVRDILNVPQERLAVYAAEDAEIALRLRDRFAADLAEVPALDRLFRTLETPLSEVLFRMEQRGIRVDTAFLAELGVEFRTQMDDLERRIHASAGREFNVQSPKQLAEILFDELGLKPTKKTASGWSTDVSVLTALAGRHPLPGLILEHRQLAKLLGTYVEAVTALVEPDTGLLHTSFNQAVAATGRLSSSDPNLQNIPVRTTEGRRIRQAFVPRDAGHVFLSADYSQIELRLLAHLSGDAALVETFRRGGDVHRRTAALIAGVGEDAVDGVMRSRAKAINFGVIYGMGARALARQIDVSVREASGFIDDYFRTYPGVREYIEHCRVAARETGYAETLLGRRRALPEILSDRDRERSFAERIAVNTPIQGTAADLIKLAMLEVDRRLTAAGSGALLLLQVHDELLLEVAPDELAATEALVREAMEGVMALSVPLVVDLHAGANWAEAHG